MKKITLILLAALAVSGVWAESVQIPTVAVLPFEVRARSGGQAADGRSIAELVGIALLETGSAELVERAELDKALDELQLSAVGLVEKESQLKLGKLVGARIIITGSMFRSGEKQYLVAKIIGTETSRVMGCSVSGTGEFAEMTGEIAPKIAAILEKQSEKLLPGPQSVNSVAKQLADTVAGRQRKVFVRVKEEIQVAVPDPAAETALKALLLELGFMSNSADLKVLNSERGREQIAERLFNAFKKFKTKYDSSLDYSTVTPPSAGASAQEGQTIAGIGERGVRYGIQIMAIGREIPEGDRSFKGYTPIIVRSGDTYKYIICVSVSEDETRASLKAVSRKFPGAFMVKIEGDRVSRP